MDRCDRQKTKMFSKRGWLDTWENNHTVEMVNLLLFIKRKSLSHFYVLLRYSLAASKHILSVNSMEKQENKWFCKKKKLSLIFCHPSIQFLTACPCQNHSGKSASRAARHPFSLQIPPTLTVGTPSVVCLEHLQREASRGILPGAWTTSHSGSCFCGGVTVQYWGLPDSLKSSHPVEDHHVLNLQPESIYLCLKPKITTGVRLRVQRKLTS